jgi:hypothetical protein
MKRIEMTVASCGECPWAWDKWIDDYLVKECNHPNTSLGEITISNQVLPDCPLPDAEPVIIDDPPPDERKKVTPEARKAIDRAFGPCH